MNDRQRDLHANDFALCEEYRLERFYLPFILRQRWCPSLNVRGPSPPTYDTAMFCVCLLAVGMRFHATHGIAGSTGIPNFVVAF